MALEKKKKSQSAEGEAMNVVGDGGYTPPATTHARVTAYLKNIHIATEIENLLPQIFPGPPEIWVENAAGEQDKELTEWMKKTANEVYLYASMQITFLERLGYGASVKSPGYEMRDGRKELVEIRNLLAITFGLYPGHGDVQNSLLPGIVINAAGEVEVWQVVDSSLRQVQITNFAILVDSTAPKPAGEAYLLPVYPVIAAINRANKAADQQVDRVGAPNVMPQLDYMQANLKTWAEAFVKRWGANTSFVVPEGVSFPDLHIRETMVAERRLEVLTKWIKSFFNPTQVLQKEGSTIGASDQEAGDIWANFIAGTQSEIEESYEAFFRPLMAANGYEDRYVRIMLKRPTTKRADAVLAAIDKAIQGKAILPREIRKNLEALVLEETTDEVLAELKEEYASAAPAGLFGNATSGFVNALPAAGDNDPIAMRTKKRIEKINREAERALLKLIEQGEEP